MVQSEAILLSMILLRVLSASIEFAAAALMYKMNRVDAALRINAALGMVGPTILISVTLLGIAGLAGKIPWSRFALIGAGVVMIFIGTRH